MGWKSKLAIHVGFWTYLALGGLVFYYVEMPGRNQGLSNQTVIQNASAFCEDLVSSAVDRILSHGNSNSTGIPSAVSITLARILSDSCDNLTLARTTPTDATLDYWEYSTALFFSMTILTTIGYGDYYPKTDAGKILCIVYGFIGIPIAGLLLASNSDYFSNGLVYIYDRVRNKRDQKRGIFAAALVFLLPGFAIFIFIPAGIFTVIEGWKYLDSVYYCFETLATIGFGDFVAGQHTSPQWMWVYRVCCIVWIMSGISYWGIVLSFITKAFKFKRIRQRWIKTSEAISHHAAEWKRVLSANGQSGDAFVAPKTKAAFEFAMHLTSSIGHLDTEDTVNHRPNVRGIATAMNPGKHHHAFQALMSLVMLGNRHQQHQEQENRTVVTENPGEQHQDHSTLEAFKIYTVSQDSGFNDDEIVTSVSSPIHGDVTPSAYSRRQGILAKQTSTKSLPGLPEETGNKNARWKNLMRSQTRPELQKNPTIDRTAFEQLLVEAMLILHEAKDHGAHLDGLAADES